MEGKVLNSLVDGIPGTISLYEGKLLYCLVDGIPGTVSLYGGNSCIA